MSGSMEPASLDALIYASMKYVGAEELSEYENADESIAFSPRAKARLVKRIKREIDCMEKHKTQRPHRTVVGMLKRVAVAALAAVTLLLTACMCIEAVREAIFDFFAQWYDTYISIEVFGNSSDDGVSSNEAPCEILEYKEPQITDKCERRVIVKNPYRYYVEYEGEEFLVTYNQELHNEYSVFVSNCKTKMTDIQIDGFEGVKTECFQNDMKIISLCWKDEEYSYLVVGNTDYDTLLSMAEGVGTSSFADKSE